MRSGGVEAAQDTARQFVMCHGLAVRAVGLLVEDAAAAYSAATAAGGEAVTPPHTLDSADGAGRTVRPLRDSSCMREAMWY
jgi:4-hydroxyphenylpyruvate dioxygenase-like putative hemolysin